MKQARLLISLLLLATVLIDLVVWPMVREWRRPNPLLAVLFALAFSQVSLATIWAAWGNMSAPWRATGAFLIVAGWSLALSHDGGTLLVMIVLLFQAFAIFLPMLILRAIGVRYTRAREGSFAIEHEDGCGERQFSLRDIFSWITATAIVLGVTQYCMGQEAINADQIVWMTLGRFAAIQIVIVFSSLWIVFGTRWATARAILFVMFLLAIESGLALYLEHPEAKPANISLMFGLELLLLLGSLWVIGMAGYRVKRSSGTR